MVKTKYKNIKSKNTKKAMSLVALLFSLALLSVLLGMFIPILTKGYIQITTGQGGLGKVNLTTSRGYFMCYFEADGRLTQARADISHIGDVNLQKEPAPAAGCQFRIPTRADSFKITLIGGGGGGAASNIEAVDRTLSTVNFRTDAGVFSTPDFTNWLDYISNDRINSALTSLFSNRTEDSQSAYICLKGNNGRSLRSEGGAKGASCLVRFNTKPDTDLHNNFILNTVSSQNPTVYANGSSLTFGDSTVEALGGANAMSVKGVAYSPEQYIINCCTGGIIGCPNEYMELCRKINNDERGAGVCRISGVGLSVNEGAACATATQNNINFVAGANVSSFNLNNTLNIPLYLKRRAFVRYDALSGDAGAVETRTVSFISPTVGTDTFQIPAEWLGTGGIGGKQEGNESFSGTAGGETRIELQTAGDAAVPMVITAAGGAGGTMKESSTLITVTTDRTNLDATPESIPEGTISGLDGAVHLDIIPQTLRITLLSPGLGVIDCKSTSCDVSTTATFPGSGGGSAGAYYSGYNSGAAPRITFRYSAALSDYVLASANEDTNAGAVAPSSPVLKSGIGGNGARGAILISW